MEERYLRCRRCHGVFEAGLAACPRCGAEYIPSPDQPASQTSSYAEKYTGSEFAPPPDAPVSAAPRRRSGLSLVLAVGAALVVTAIAVSAFILMGALDTPAPTPRQDIVVAKTPTPTPLPTLPPTITRTLEQLADPNANVHVSIRTTITVNARVTGQSVSVIKNLEIDLANGNESGTSQVGASTQEWRLVNGTYYLRQLPTGKWSARAGFSPFIVLSPLFLLTEPRMLQYDGPETKNGTPTEKLESTRWWAPDSSKLSGYDVATLGINPLNTKLQLWVTEDGTPVYATFRAWTDTSDGTGTNLLDITTTYQFTNQGQVQQVPTPTMK